MELEKVTVDTQYEPLKFEREVREFWKKHEIPRRLRELRERKNIGYMGYVEGPPTMNGYCHVGHSRGRAIKDLWYRFNTMRGYYILYRAGWDTQGLPVELQAEKELGFRNKKEALEKLGMEKFIKECKRIVHEYNKHWLRVDKKFGMFMDYDKAYWTYKDEYMEREWRYLKEAWKKKLLGRGYRVVAYCPGCQTSLSNAEVGLGYEEVQDPSILFKFKLRGEDTYLIIWTTMPFTLITNEMVAVHPNAVYAKIKVGSESWIIVKNRLEEILKKLGVEEWEILKEIYGRELEGKKYEYPFYEEVPKQRELEHQNKYIHTVVCEEFVDIETATGIVHLAPANGEEDFEAAQKRGVPIFVPYDDEVKFTEEAGNFGGEFARDCDKIVIEKLRKKSLLLQEETITHEYPTCWRSHHKLVWLARNEYFLWTDKINDTIVKAAEKVEYFYEPPKNRFLSFLREAKPWCISRERTWGTPLPIFKCKKCGETELIASRREIIERGVRLPDGEDFELHRPWIDRIELRCIKCGGIMKREPFVLDTWHNSGAAPYASLSDEEFERYVPVEFLVEGIDQTRGWANTLLLLHVILTGKAEPPYKAFLFYGLVLDRKGRKMAKSLGNVVLTEEVVDNHSADLYRFYLLWKTAPIENMNFDIEEMWKRPYQVLNTLFNLNKLFLQNAGYDNYTPLKIENIKRSSLRVEDLWILSRLQGVVKIVTESFEKARYHVALREMEKFIIEDLSRKYIPIIRRDLWEETEKATERRKIIYTVLWKVLRTLNRLLNPVAPFLIEAIHQKIHRIFDRELPESINFDNWPEVEEIWMNTELEKVMEQTFKIIESILAARQNAGIKRRWPLKWVNIETDMNIMPTLEVIKRLTNVKEVLLNQKIEEENVEIVEGDKYKIYLFVARDEELIYEGLVRDIARRIQALRKERGYEPTYILSMVEIYGIEKELRRLERYRVELKKLVRAREVKFVTEKEGNEWRKYKVNGKTIEIRIQ